MENAEDEVDDIITEIAILSGMNSPYVTKYYGSYLHGSDLWIVMEFCSGGSCADLMRPGPIGENEIAIILKELLMGLTYLHDDQKLHRDIKGEDHIPEDESEMLTLFSCQHPDRREWSGETCRFRCLWPAISYYDQEEHIRRNPFLDGTGSH